MGKRIIPRARGKGGPRYKTPSHRFLGSVDYFPSIGKGNVIDIVHDPGRSAPVAIIKFEDGKEILHVAPEGISVGDWITYQGEPVVGNVCSISKIPEGTKIFGLETFPGNGPKLCRSSGVFATIVSRTGDKVTVLFPSGKSKIFDGRCRATIGIPAGSGRVEKPWVKGSKHGFQMWSRGKIFPRSKGVAMTPTDHPYGGRSKRPRPSRAVSRDAPPGAKVGAISPRRMGKRKGR
ncbi:MAG: 50S ribosomal protein L2 [Candidatus Aenigmatarchaeota archaeon]